MTGHFSQAGVEPARLTAELLLAHVIGTDRLHLYMEADRPAGNAERDALRDLVRRAARGEPVQYLVGSVEFRGLELEVDPSTLIPQPCTERIVDFAVEWRSQADRPGESAIRFADVGTGSGCIAIALLKAWPDASAVATDIIPAALALARRNADRHGVADRIDLLEGDGLAPLQSAAPPRFDLICSNPPYIPDHEWDGGRVEPSVRDHVPESALRGGPDGLNIIRPLIAGAGDLLEPGGLLIVEVADAHADQAADLARSSPGLANVRIERDEDDLRRFVIADRAADS